MHASAFFRTAGATAVDRVEFARKVAERFGLTSEIVLVRTDDVKLLAPKPLRSGLDVSRAEKLLRSKPLGIDAALELFFEQWKGLG